MTDRNTVGSDESARTKHFLSVYIDEEKEWLVKTDEEERDRGRGFMKRIKERWDAKYPNRNHVSTQNLRDNLVRYRMEMNESNTTNEIQQEMVDQNLNTNNTNADKTNNKWTNEMKLELLKIDREERSKGRRFMKRMKEGWDYKYPGLPVTAQCLRDNAARISKDKALLNLLEMQNQSETVNNANHAAPIPVHEDQIEAVNHVNHVEAIPGHEIDHRQTIETENTNRQNEARQLGIEETQEIRDMKLKFQEILVGLKPTTNNGIAERACLEKLKKGVQNPEVKMANIILEESLAQTNDICKLTDAVYAMGKNIKERMGIKKKDNRRNNKTSGNRRIRKIEKELKDTRIMVKCAEIVFRKGKMVKGEALPLLEEKMEALDPEKNEVYKLLGCEQSDDIDTKMVLERAKK